jgi:predicted membrane channel-forming protein YqfA (hemolysin III family)
VEERDHTEILGIWLAYTVTDILYGLLRKFVITPKLGDYIGHVIGVSVLIILVFALSYVFVKNMEPQSYSIYNFFFVGITWFVLSSIVLFGYNRYIGENSWDPFLKEIDITKGGLRALFLLAELIAPSIFGSFRLLSLRHGARH